MAVVRFLVIAMLIGGYVNLTQGRSRMRAQFAFKKSSSLLKTSLHCDRPPVVDNARIASTSNSRVLKSEAQPFDWVRYECIGDDYAMIPPDGAVVTCRRVPSEDNKAVWGFSPTLADAGFQNLPICVNISQLGVQVPALSTNKLPPLESITGASPFPPTRAMSPRVAVVPRQNDGIRGPAMFPRWPDPPWAMPITQPAFQRPSTVPPPAPSAVPTVLGSDKPDILAEESNSAAESIEEETQDERVMQKPSNSDRIDNEIVETEPELSVMPSFETPKPAISPPPPAPWPHPGKLSNTLLSPMIANAMKKLQAKGLWPPRGMSTQPHAANETMNRLMKHWHGRRSSEEIFVNPFEPMNPFDIDYYGYGPLPYYNGGATGWGRDVTFMQTCGPPPIIPDTYISTAHIPDPYGFGRVYDWARYACVDNFQLIGSDVVVCTLGGRWMNARETLPVCQWSPPTTSTTTTTTTTTTLPPPTQPPVRYYKDHYANEAVLLRLFGFIDEWLATGRRPDFAYYGPQALQQPPQSAGYYPIGQAPPGQSAPRGVPSYIDASSPYAVPSYLRSNPGGPGPGPGPAPPFFRPPLELPFRTPPQPIVPATPGIGGLMPPQGAVPFRAISATDLRTCGPPPYIPDATVISGSLLAATDFAFPRDWIQYQCDDGFELFSSDTVLCMPDGRWMNEYSTLPTCTSPGMCSPPPNITLAIVSWTSLVIGSEAIYDCTGDKDYVAVGTTTTIICQRNGTWSTPDFECLLQSLPGKCDRPPVIRNGYIKEDIQRDNFGEYVIYACDYGSLVGNSLVRCRPYSGWETPPRCPPPP